VIYIALLRKPYGRSFVALT